MYIERPVWCLQPISDVYFSEILLIYNESKHDVFTNFGVERTVVPKEFNFKPDTHELLFVYLNVV